MILLDPRVEVSRVIPNLPARLWRDSGSRLDSCLRRNDNRDASVGELNPKERLVICKLILRGCHTHMADEEIKLSANLQKIADQIEKLTVIEVADLAKYLEEKFGVSAMPMMAAPAVGGVVAADAAPAEEKTAFNVVLTGAGEQKLAVIKAVRELRQDLGLMDAKKLVETPPQDLLTGVKKEEAEEAKTKLEAAGATVELK